MAKNSKSSQRISHSNIVLLAALLCGAIFISIFFASFCISENKKVEMRHAARIDYTGDAVKNAIQVANNASYAYESRCDTMLQSFLYDFNDYFIETGGDPNQINLTKLQQKYWENGSENNNLYIIDEYNVIVAGTVPNSVGYDYSAYPEFTNELDELRTEYGIVLDIAMPDKITGGIYKSAFLSSSEHPYILKFATAMDELDRIDNSLYHGLDLSIITAPENVHLFSRQAELENDPAKGLVSIGSYDQKLSDLPGRTEYISRAFAEKTRFYIYIPEENKRIDYIFIPYPGEGSPSHAYVNQVLEVTSSLNPLQKALVESTLFFASLALIFIAMFLAMGGIIIWYVIYPINRIIDDIEIVANGAYDHKIRETNGPEFDSLVASLNKIVRTLKTELETNKENAQRLDEELTHRRIADNSLLNATRQLNLLGSITRHDILNQIMVATTILEFITDENELRNEHEKINEDYLTQVRTAIKNIEKQIQFTRLYEQMGLKEPVWQMVSPMISNAGSDLSYPPEMICDTVGSLAVLADSMFDRVVYNMLDNAKRYGTDMTKFEASFTELESGDGLLVFEDDGPGVEYDKKELIFMRGYGSNTGLGLFLVREILSITNIEIKETGSPGKGARFELSIPKGFWRYEESK